jgi:hypothetical protein
MEKKYLAQAQLDFVWSQENIHDGGYKEGANNEGDTF